MATYQGYTESVELLFEMGGSIEVHGKHGMTALLWASQQGTVVGCCSLWLSFSSPSHLLWIYSITNPPLTHTIPLTNRSFDGGQICC